MKNHFILIPNIHELVGKALKRLESLDSTSFYVGEDMQTICISSELTEKEVTNKLARYGVLYKRIN